MSLNLEGVNELVVIILALSAASERLVAIIKGVSYFQLGVQLTDKKKEQVRVAWLRAISLAAGIVTAMFASGLLMQEKHLTWWGIIGLGILASGGSDFWNSILGWLNAVKDAKKKGV